MTQRKREYAAKKEAYMAAHPVCEACLLRGVHPPAPSEIIHHKEGRGINAAGRDYFLDETTFCASCKACDYWIHKNEAEAEKIGLIKRQRDRRVRGNHELMRPAINWKAVKAANLYYPPSPHITHDLLD